VSWFGYPYAGVTGAHAAIECLADAGEDEHGYDPDPSKAATATTLIVPVANEAKLEVPPYSKCIRLGASRMRNMRAGTPATTAFAGTSRVTTAFVPITALSPTVTPRRMHAP
jgi:hypothetical protein